MAAVYPDVAGWQGRFGHGRCDRNRRCDRAPLARQKSTVIFFDINDEAGTGLALELSGERLAANFLHVDLTDEASARTSQHFIVDGGWV